MNNTICKKKLENPNKKKLFKLTIAFPQQLQTAPAQQDAVLHKHEAAIQLTIAPIF